eukprot:GHVO01046648.1.p1 GENE.GHVO01046648.1~~GHVO01046648.1.p1  ORF type:complete len:147 (+),score=15.76 GHVO01046648.1:94-534(+)
MHRQESRPLRRLNRPRDDSMMDECSCLEAVHLDRLSGGKADSLQEITDVLTLVSLQLDDLSILRVLYDCSIASEFLLSNLDDLFQVKFGFYTLHGGEGFATIALLDADVHIAVCASYALLFLAEGIEDLKVVKCRVGHTNVCWFPI